MDTQSSTVFSSIADLGPWTMETGSRIYLMVLKHLDLMLLDHPEVRVC